MKKLLVAIALTGFVAAAFGQGQVQFKNYVANSATTINAPVYLDIVGGTKLNSSNTAWRAALIGGPSSSAVFAIVDNAKGIYAQGNLLTLFGGGSNSTKTWANFRTGTVTSVADGIINPGAATYRVVSAADWGTSAAVQLVAWQGNYNTWAEAFTAAITGVAGVKIGASNPLTLTLPASSTDPALTYLTGLQSFAIVTVPEPTTLAFAGLGLASLLIFRRRN